MSATREEQETAELHDGEHGSRLRLVLDAISDAKSVLIMTGNALAREAGIMMPAITSSLEMRRCVTIEGFREDPEGAWRWWNGRIEEIQNARPAAGHKVLARTQSVMKKFMIVTQTVDGLHQRAGLKNVNELHGNLNGAHCERCDKKMTLKGPLEIADIEHECGGIFRPSVVLEGERLSASAFGHAVMAAQRAGVIISIGLDNVTMPIAALLEPRGNKPFVVDVNMRPNFGTSPAMVTLPYSPSAFLVAMVGHLESQQEPKSKKRWMGQSPILGLSI